MDLEQFLREIITTESGYFCLAHAYTKDTEEETHKTWTEEFYSWPKDIHKIVNRVTELGNGVNIYFSPYLFSKTSSQKANVLPSRTIVADLDEANILTLPLKPTVLVETSSDRHQGYWVLKDQLELEDHEQLSRKVTYSIPRCDKTGWFIGKKVRVPFTMNLKYVTGPKYIRIVDSNGLKYTSEDLINLPTIRELYGKEIDVDEEVFDWVEEAKNFDIGPQELLASLRSSLPTRVVTQYNIQAPDRSTALWALMTSAFRAGLDRKKVWYLAFHSANNKFKDLKFGGIKELAKDVLRAELAVSVKMPDIKSKILEVRKMTARDFEIHRYIAELVLDAMSKMGSFVHTNDDNCWFIREDTGRPIMLGVRSEQLESMLETFFGINGSEKIASYIVRYVTTYVKELPVMGQTATLSYYDQDSKTFMLHTGRKGILRVTPDTISEVTNGYDGIVFPWTQGNTAINPKYKTLDNTWDMVLFDGCLDNILGLTADQARAVLKTWFLSVLMRDALVSRPILACFGQPGAGKSTLFRRIYTLMYGKDRSLNAITKEEDFDYATVTDPLVVMDNVDSTHRWLPDRLAISAATSEWTRRKLFTDSDVMTLKRQAMLALTAHAPKFGREDVTDRMLLLTFERLPHFQPETQIIERIFKLRNALWGEILKDIQRIMNHPVPRSGWPQFRVEDFARFGYWIAQALCVDESFYTGIEQIRKEQRVFSLDEDAILVDALMAMMNKPADQANKRRTPGELWGYLQAIYMDPPAFTRRYPNAISLGKKLWTLQDALKELFDIKWEMDSQRKTRVWTFFKKEDAYETSKK